MKALRLLPEQVRTGSLILVNRDYDYAEPGRPQANCSGMERGSKHVRAEALSVLGGRSGAPVLLARRAAVLFAGLMDEIGGWSRIVPVSGYRTLAEQKDIWNSSLAEHGKDFTNAYVALPGHSEHQTGLAIDLGLRGPELDFIRPAFPYEGICQRFRERAADFGFVERYPAGKETVTGIAHEPWHFRYVGQVHARELVRRGLVLEEYLA